MCVCMCICEYFLQKPFWRPWEKIKFTLRSSPTNGYGRVHPDWKSLRESRSNLHIKWTSRPFAHVTGIFLDEILGKFFYFFSINAAKLFECLQLSGWSILDNCSFYFLLLILLYLYYLNACKFICVEYLHVIIFSFSNINWMLAIFATWMKYFVKLSILFFC